MNTMVMNAIWLSILCIVIVPWFFIAAMPVVIFTGVFVFPAVFLVYYFYQNVKTIKPMKVLVADDDAISIAPLLAGLANRSVDVLFVENGKEAIDALGTQKFDLLFLDMFMNDIRGDNVLRLSEPIENGSAKTPVIFYTGSNDKTQGLLDEDFHQYDVKGVWGKKMPFVTLNQQLDQVFADVV